MKPTKYHTIIFVPHARARYRKFHVSDRALRGLAIGFGVSLVLALFSTISFFAGLRSYGESTRLRAENQRLREANEKYASSIDGLKKTLEQFEGKVGKLAILAGMSDARELDRGGLGGRGTSTSAQDLELLFAGDASSSNASEVADRTSGISKRIESVESELRRHSTALAAIPSIAPIVGVPTTGYGSRQDPFSGEGEFHPALDISAATGTPVMAPADGIVTEAGWENGYGRMIRIAHGYGVVTLYGHLSQVDVSPGRRVTRGQIIGRVGSTGRSTGPHLHYEVVVDGQHENPLKYILNAF